jgi:CBS domain-containing protein
MVAPGDDEVAAQTAMGGVGVKVRDAMTEEVLTITPERTLREAARFMTKHNVGAAVIIDPEQPGPGIITERDVLQSVGRGEDPNTELVEDHQSAEVTFAAPEWSLERAAEAMVRGGFRHLVVVDGGELVGVLSMRDIVRCWVQDGATSALPREESA